MRIALPVDRLVKLKNEEYIIKSIIGTGASCIAYEAMKVNASGEQARCRIKECYPYDAEIVRNGDNIIWKSDDEKEKALIRFSTGVRILNSLHNIDSIGNSIPPATLIQANGTLYSIMDITYGVTYDEDKHTSLEEITDTMMVLAKTISNLHKEGYLHLDLKPSNFLVSYDPSIYVWLFDADTIISQNELANHSHISLPYSQSWAAPEQILQKTEKIGPWTDVYTIGAILFSKLLGHKPTLDDINCFAGINFPENIIKENNPKVIYLLKKILHKSLTASITRRYQSAYDLYIALREVSQIIHAGKPYFTSNFTYPTNYFTGRDTEIKSITKMMANGTHFLFIHGYGGIGKSELAKQYAVSAKDRYAVVLFLRYKGSIKEQLYEFTINNFDGVNNDKEALFPALFDENTLLIVDNFDVAADSDPFIPALLQYRSDIIFTTRNDFSSVYDCNHIYELNTLPTLDLISIFQHYSRINEMNMQDEEVLCELFKQVGYHTYAVELLARQTAYSGWSLLDLKEEFTKGLLTASKAGKLLSTKDDTIIRETIPEIMRVLFRLTALNVQQKRVLRNMWFLKFMVVTKKIYRTALRVKEKEMEALNSLIELGLIHCNSAEQNDPELIIHPLILETIKSELKPKLAKCKEIINFIIWEYASFIWPDKDTLEMDSIFLQGDTAIKYEYENRCAFFLHFFASIDMSEELAMILFKNWAEHSFKNPFRAPYDSEDDSCLWEVPEAEDSYEESYLQISSMLRNVKRKQVTYLTLNLLFFMPGLRLGDIIILPILRSGILFDFKERIKHFAIA